MANRLFSLYAAIFAYMNNPVKGSEDKRSIVIGRIKQKHSLKKTLAIVRLNNSLFIMYDL